MSKKKTSDPNLDSPSVANQQKHINFLEEEEKEWQIDDTGLKTEEETKRRKEEWKKGIEEGRKNKSTS